MTAPTTAEARDVSAALLDTARDLDAIIESLPPTLDPSTAVRRKEIAEYLADRAEILNPTH